MPRLFKCHFTNLVQTESLLLYETDKLEDVRKRISGTARYPPLLFFPTAFDLVVFLNDNTAFSFLDLGALWGTSTVSSETTSQTLPALYLQIKNDYTLPLVQFLEDWIFYELYVKFQNPDMSTSKVAGSYLLVLKNILTMDFLKRFETPLIDTVTKRRINRRDFLERITKEWYTAKLGLFLSKTTAIEEDNRRSAALGTLFDDTAPLSVSDMEEIGRIIILDVPTTSLGTGIVFDRLVLNDDLCVAQYKNFYKTYTLRAIVPSAFVEKAPDFYSTSVYTFDGKLTVHVQNVSSGLRIQAIVTKNTFLANRDVVFDFLRVPTEGTTETSAGLMAEFYVNNPSPLEPGIPWSALQAPLFANLAMNDDDFSKFISINDTDKVSRQNNSLYVYFYDPIPMPTTETIQVSGWNRLASRFGDLTAILTPMQFEAGDTKVHVKITRSANQAVIDKFVYFFSRMLRMYNDKYTEQLQIFQAMIPGYQPVLQESSGTTPVMATLSTMDPILFPSNVYSRSCQNPNPIVITAQEAEKLPEERRLLFPPKEAGGVPPRWYTCPTMPYEKDNKVYAYPGLKKLKKITHPFHAAPCCYLKPHTDKNKTFVNAVLHPPPSKSDRVVVMPKIRPLETQKIINHVGQRGRLPPVIEDFMRVLHPSSAEHFRVGVPTHWEDEPILAALEYYYGVREQQPFFRSPSVLRALLLQEPLQITMQQNYDIGVEGVAQILRDNEYMDPSRFYKLLENFYRVNLLVLTRNKDQTIRILRPRYLKSYYWNLVRSRPTVFLYQHFGGSADSSDEDVHAQCELIGYTTTSKKDEVSFDFPSDQKLQQVFQLAVATFQGDRLNLPLFLPHGHPMIAALDSQVLDGFGKTRVLLFTEAKYVAVLGTPMAPLLLPSLLKTIMLPAYKDVVEFLDACQVPVLHVQEFEKRYLFLDVNLFTPMVFVTRYADIIDVEVELLEQEPPFLQYLLPDRQSVFSEMTWTQRFASILQDYLVILLSEYLHMQKDSVTTKSIPEIIDSFLEEKVRYDSGYVVPSPTDVSPLVQENPDLFREEQLVLPLSFQRKMPFFLRWWMTTKSDDMRRMRDFRELPSFFQYTDDFVTVPFHMIQNTVANLQDISSHQTYLKTPLHVLAYPFFKPSLVAGQVYYYYNPYETPEPHPYLLMVAKKKEELLRMGHRYLVEKKDLEPIGPPLQSYWERSSQSSGPWTPKGPRPHLMALFHDVEYSQYYGLYPFTSA